jgi:DNA mismatch repair ATPase MutS
LQQTTLLSEDADKRAVDDLSKQAKEASSATMATLIRARRDQIRAEITAEREIEKALNKSLASLLDTIEQAVQATGPASIINASDDELLNLLIAGGLGEAVLDLSTQQSKINKTVDKVLTAIEPSLSLDSLAPQVDALSSQNISDIVEGVILPSIKQNIRDSLRDLEVNVPLNTVMSNLQVKMARAQGRQLTEIKTKISQYGRGLTAMASAVAELDHYLYTGPRDGITRDFCRALVNKVVDEQQMSKLNNGQGLAVKTSGGGYNCRHSWSPVTESFIEAAKLTRATASDISDANKGGKK